jgi:hypothetical protein
MMLRRIAERVKAQNWSAVALEFFVVVLGVGVAMLGQQWLSEHQQRADMAVAETALQSDLLSNYFVSKERLSVANCRIQSYNAMAAQLLAAGENWTGIARAAGEGSHRVALPVALRSPSRNWGSHVWQAEMGRGTFNQMADDRRQALDVIFISANHAEQLQNDIYALQARSKVLAVNTRISQSDRLRYYDMLAEMDEKSGLLELIAEQIVQRIDEMGIEIPSKDRPRVLKDLTSEAERIKGIYGDCYQPQEWPVLDARLENAKTP